MKKRLMSIDDFKRNLCHYCNTYMSEEPCEPDECWVHDVIAQTDTVDAVEVVRCKDCKHRIYDGIAKENWCNHDEGLSSVLSDTDFCSYGERRNDETD